MKYPYTVKYNGVIYPAGEDVPDETKAEDNKEAKKPEQKKTK